MEMELGARRERVLSASAHVILVRIYSFRIEPFSTFLFCFLQVFAYPDVAIESEN
jgi:hypothetical protein